MLTKKYQERLLVLSGLLTEATNNVYYHGSGKFVGDMFLFKPTGFYEKIDKNNNPIYRFDEFVMSDIPEISASKYIGGAILGCFSTTRIQEIFIYTIHENPTVDISHWGGDDFEFLEEVRYRKPVKCTFLKKINLSKEFYNMLILFYEIKNARYTEEFPELPDNFDFDKFENKIHKVLKSFK